MNEWIRASREFRCAVCNRPDWCTYNKKFKGWSCMRQASAKPMKNGGHWHPDGTHVEHRPLPKPEEDKPQINACAIMEEFAAGTKAWWLDELAKLLRVSRIALDKIGAAWAPGKQLRQHEMVFQRCPPSNARWPRPDGRHPVAPMTGKRFL
jgi:hypothetical protein